MRSTLSPSNAPTWRCHPPTWRWVCWRHRLHRPVSLIPRTDRLACLAEWALLIKPAKTERTTVRRHVDNMHEVWRTPRKLGSLLGDADDVTCCIQLASVAFHKLWTVWYISVYSYGCVFTLHSSCLCLQYGNMGLDQISTRSSGYIPPSLPAPNHPLATSNIEPSAISPMPQQSY